MSIYFVPTFRGRIDVELVTKRKVPQLKREALVEIMDHHIQVMVPLHFQLRAETRPGGLYRYAARTKRYQIRKAREVRHQIPLVRHGDLRRIILANLTANVRKTQYGINTSAAATGHPTMAEMPDRIRAEIEFIPEIEKKLMGRRFLHAFAARLNDPKNRRRRGPRKSAAD